MNPAKWGRGYGVEDADIESSRDSATQIFEQNFSLLILRGLSDILG